MNEFILQIQETPIQIWGTLAAFVLAVIIIIVAKQIKANKEVTKPLSTKMLALGGMCVALSFVLSYIKLFSMPQGGSVTLASMVPIIFFAFVAGPTAGLIAGLAYGFLQFFQDAYAAHWVSIILDYPLAFAFLGLAGIIPSKMKSLELRFILGTSLAMVGRFFMHVLSGAIYFGEYAPEGMNPWVYAMGYNAGFLGVELIITLIIGIILIKTPVYKTLKVMMQK
ncbi:MAG: energy-coupled thiamine transporter ThiT [Cellulosilyticaceae bacterium]